ncbi:Exonuclease 3'-5' domain-containing protein 2 [Lobulomyces angularis]|nr:Exonuclease 3'-5' domain-containing protein 2 [Lobulomyces angularis]
MKKIVSRRYSIPIHKLAPVINSCEDNSPRIINYDLNSFKETNLNILYTAKTNEIDNWCSENLNYATESGFDLEMKPAFFKSKISTATVIAPATFQIAVKQNSEYRTLVAHVHHLPKTEFPKNLAKFFNNHRIQKNGVAIKEDHQNIRRFYEKRGLNTAELNPVGFKDLVEYSKLLWYTYDLNENNYTGDKRVAPTTFPAGLKSMSFQYLGMKIEKKKNIQCSNWENPLSQIQVNYAAMDSLLGLILRERFLDLLEKEKKEYDVLGILNAEKALLKEEAKLKKKLAKKAKLDGAKESIELNKTL